MYVKNKKTGLVENNSDMQTYLQQKNLVKKNIEDKRKLKETTEQLASLQNDFKEMKAMMQQLITTKK